MADQTTHEHDHHDDDELIHVPEGQSRLRYLLTIGLVLFLLVIFVVADNFQNALTSRGNAAGDDVYLRWQDPMTGEVTALTRSEFQRSARVLELGLALGLFPPPSYIYGDPMERRSSPNVTADDVASFLVYEGIADNGGVDVSEREVKDRLIAAGGEQAVGYAANRYRMSGAAVAEATRRLLRVQKVYDIVKSPLLVNDSSEAVTRWQDRVPEYKFQIASAQVENFETAAREELPGDEELERWFKEDLAPFEKQKLFTDPRVVPTVAYVPLEGDAFDAATLLERYPLAEGTDEDALAQAYYDYNRTFRFMRPVEEAAEGEDPAPATPYELEEVKDQALAEAKIKAALDAFLTDVQDRAAEGEDGVDFVAEAQALGLTVDTPEGEGYTRAEVVEADGWGSTQISGQIMFTPAGQFVNRVVVSADALTIARIDEQMPAAEPEFQAVRDEVVELWVKDRSGAIAVERLAAVRDGFGETDENEGDGDGEKGTDGGPVVEAAAFRAAVETSGLEFYDRPYLGQGEEPEGEASKADQYVQRAFPLYSLEEGQVAAPSLGREKDVAFLVRLDSKRAKDPSEITPREHMGQRNSIQRERLLEFCGEVFRGDGAWLVERAKIEWPLREDDDDTDEEGEDGSES